MQTLASRLWRDPVLALKFIPQVERGSSWSGATVARETPTKILAPSLAGGHGGHPFVSPLAENAPYSSNSEQTPPLSRVNSDPHLPSTSYPPFNSDSVYPLNGDRVPTKIQEIAAKADGQGFATSPSNRLRNVVPPDGTDSAKNVPDRSGGAQILGERSRQGRPGPVVSEEPPEYSKYSSRLGEPAQSVRVGQDPAAMSSSEFEDYTQPLQPQKPGTTTITDQSHASIPLSGTSPFDSLGIKDEETSVRNPNRPSRSQMANGRPQYRPTQAPMPDAKSRAKKGPGMDSQSDREVPGAMVGTFDEARRYAEEPMVRTTAYPTQTRLRHSPQRPSNSRDHLNTSPGSRSPSDIADMERSVPPQAAQKDIGRDGEHPPPQNLPSRNDKRGVVDQPYGVRTPMETHSQRDQAKRR